MSNPGNDLRRQGGANEKKKGEEKKGETKKLARESAHNGTFLGKKNELEISPLSADFSCFICF